MAKIEVEQWRVRTDTLGIELRNMKMASSKHGMECAPKEQPSQHNLLVVAVSEKDRQLASLT